MKYETAMRQKLIALFGSLAKDLNASLAVEPQAIIRLTPARKFEDSDWRYITETVEAKGGCWENAENVWKLPRFMSRINLPSQHLGSRSERLFIRSLALKNLVFLHDAFKGKMPASWKEVQSALCSLQPKRGGDRKGYSKATCRDYLGALLALETR
jgi:hypothetical protein